MQNSSLGVVLATSHVTSPSDSSNGVISDENSGGLIAIAEYGQEYGKEILSEFYTMAMVIMMLCRFQQKEVRNQGFDIQGSVKMGSTLYEAMEPVRCSLIVGELNATITIILFIKASCRQFQSLKGSCHRLEGLWL